MNIEWEEPPEETRGRNSLYAAFAGELRQHPKRWAKYPREFVSKASVYTTVANQRRGEMVSFPKDEFEMAARGLNVYVRYIGNGAA